MSSFGISRELQFIVCSQGDPHASPSMAGKGECFYTEEKEIGKLGGLCSKYPGEGKGYPLQYSGLKNFMDCMVHGVTKSQRQVSDFDFHTVNKELVAFRLLSRCGEEKSLFFCCPMLGCVQLFVAHQALCQALSNPRR